MARATMEEKIEAVAAIDALRNAGKTIDQACEELDFPGQRYLSWKAQIKKHQNAGGTTAPTPPAANDEAADADALIDELIQGDLDEWYDAWRIRALKLLESSNPAAVASGKLIDQLLAELADKLGWELE